MLEGFYINCPSGYGSTWWWDNLANISNQLAGSGFTAVWIPCCLKGASGGYSSGYDPFDDYDLGSKNQMGTVPTHYGDRTQLERACAVMKANGLQVYEDIVDSHRDGASNYDFKYADADGNPTGGRFPKSASDFYPNVSMGEDVIDPYDTPDGDWIQPTTGGRYLVNGEWVCYAGYNMLQSGDWLTKALDLDGYRFDDVRATPWDWLATFMNSDSMAGKFCVAENWDTDTSDLNNWLSNDMADRTSAFDFPLRMNYLMPMCNNPAAFDMASLDHAGLTGVNPIHSVTFVENHDTDGSYQITQNKLMAYAYILTSEGYPCVFYKDWSTDPGCYGSGMQSQIDNLIWIHENIADGATQQRWENNQIFCYERLGGSHLLVGLNNDTTSPHTITCATGFGANVDLHDYTGHEPDVTTDTSGNATITLPVNNGGLGYVAYSVSGINNSFTPIAGSTTQEYAGAQDLDIKPADNTMYVTAAAVEASAGSTVSESLYFDSSSWSGATRIKIELLNPTGSIISTKAYSRKTTQGASLTAAAATTGLYIFKVRSVDTPSANLKPDYWLRATYTAPQTIVPVTFQIADADTSGAQRVEVCGKIVDLGNNQPAEAFVLNSWQNNGANSTWSGEIALPPGATIEYRYVKWDGTTAVWEKRRKTPSGDREITVPLVGTLLQNDGDF
jgi:alpha-amylase